MNIILSLLRYIVIESKYYHSYVLLISLKKIYNSVSTLIDEWTDKIKKRRKKYILYLLLVCKNKSRKSSYENHGR